MVEPVAESREPPDASGVDDEVLAARLDGVGGIGAIPTRFSVLASKSCLERDAWGPGWRSGQATAIDRWTFMRLNAVAARCSSLDALSRPRREKRSMIFFRLPMPGSTVAPRRL